MSFWDRHRFAVHHCSILKWNMYPKIFCSFKLLFSFVFIVSCLFAFSRFCLNNLVEERGPGRKAAGQLLAPSVSRRKEQRCRGPSSTSSSPCLILSQEWLGWRGSSAIQLRLAPSLTSKISEIHLEQQNGCSTSACNSMEHSSRRQFKV